MKVAEITTCAIALKTQNLIMDPIWIDRVMRLMQARHCLYSFSGTRHSQSLHHKLEGYPIDDRSWQWTMTVLAEG